MTPRRNREILPPLSDHPGADSETYQTMAAVARRRTGAIPPDLFVRQALASALDGDWPVKREGLEALLRRYGFCQRDRLTAGSKPDSRRILGVYQTKRMGHRGGTSDAARQPYRTLLLALDPLATSCDCADFQRSALGLCKHGMAVLEHLASRPRSWRKGLREQQESIHCTEPRLRWDPFRPLTGPGDWLARVVWLPGTAQNGRRKIAKAERAAQGCFQDVGLDTWKLLSAHGDSAEQRLALVEALQAFWRLDTRRAERGGKLPSDPVLAPLLATEIERLQRLGIVGELRQQGTRSSISLHHKLYPYQQEGLDSFLRSGRLLLADDMGLGKTAQAIAAANALWRLGLAKRGLLLVPAALKSQWLREWESFCDVPIQVVEGRPEARAALYRCTDNGFLIANYEQLLRDLPEMHRFDPELMILDEAQRIKNWATKTAAYVKQLRPRFRLVLTGTPMENRLEELASIMDWVDNRALEPKWRLVPWHTSAADGQKVITGARNLDTLRERLAPVMLRRVRQEVLPQLPARTDTRVPAPFTEAQAEEHDALKRPLRDLMRRAQKRPLTQAEFLRLMQLLTQQRIICNGLALFQFDEIWPSFAPSDPTPGMLRRLDSPKLLELREMVEQLVVQQGRKVVIFSQWRRMLQLAQWVTKDLLATAGVRAAFFSGQESQKRRAHNIVDFHDDPNMRLLLCSDAGGVGLNLQHAASCLINLDLPWNPAVLEQRIGRIHRLGQKRPIQVYHLISEAGIEARIEGTIGVKKALFDGLFDGTSDAVEFDRSASFLDQLQRVMEPPIVPELPDAQGAALDELDDDLDATDVALPAVDVDDDVDNELAAASDDLTMETANPPVSAEGDAAPGDDPTAGLISPSQVQQLLTRLEVNRKPDGGLTIDAPPEAAEALAALFAGVANLISKA